MNNAVSSSGSQRLSDEEVLRAVPPLSGMREFRVGIFVILGIVGFFTVLFLMTSPALFRGRYMLVTEVADAGGIRRGDPVRMRGINIGRVYSFELAPSGGVYITMELEGEFPIPAEASTELLSMGFLGGMVVSVIPGDSDDYVEAWDIIPGTSAGGVLDQAGDLAGDVSDVMGRVQGLLADSTISDVGALMASMRELMADLAAVADGQEAEFRTLMESLQRSAANMEGVTGSEDWSATLASAENTMAALERTSTTISESAGHLNTILARLERGEGTLGKLLTTDELHASVDSTLQSLEELLDDIRENPGRYVTIEIF